MAFTRIPNADFERISRTTRRIEKEPYALRPRKRQRLGAGIVVEGFTGTVTVVTALAFDADGCLASYTTTDLAFENGLLKTVT